MHYIANGLIFERGAPKCVSDHAAVIAKCCILDRGAPKCIFDLAAVTAKGRILNRGAPKWIPEGILPESAAAAEWGRRRGGPDPTPRAEEPG